MKLPKFIAKRLSLSLSLMVVCAIALLLSASMAVMLHFSRQAIKRETMNDAAETLEGSVQQIDNILLSVEQSAGNVYWDMLRHLDEPDRMITYCRRLVECNPYIVGCAIVFKPNYYPGRELFMAYIHRAGNSVTTNEGSDLVQAESFGNRPYTEQVWYTDPMTTGHAGWTDPLKNEDAEDEALTSFCLPIYDKSMQCVGVLAVDLSIELLSQIVLSAKPSPNSYSTLLSHTGSYIVHPDKDKLANQTVFTQTERGADPSVRVAAEAMLSGEAGLKRFLMNGQEWYVFYKPFQRAVVPGRSMDELKWSVGVVYPKNDIFGNYNRLLYLVLAIAIISVLIFFVLCCLVAHRQLLPLRMLTGAAQHIAEGHYENSIPSTRREDEIGLLQENFQQMQQSLATNISELEQMTTTLRERSKVLRNAYDQAQEADRMKTAFLHYMTNQMTEPSEVIDRSVTKLCNDYHEISLQEVNQEVENIHQQSKTIIDLLSHMIQAAEKETGKEEAHE